MSTVESLVVLTASRSKGADHREEIGQNLPNFPMTSGEVPCRALVI